MHIPSITSLHHSCEWLASFHYAVFLRHKVSFNELYMTQISFVNYLKFKIFSNNYVCKISTHQRCFKTLFCLQNMQICLPKNVCSIAWPNWQVRHGMMNWKYLEWFTRWKNKDCQWRQLPNHLQNLRLIFFFFLKLGTIIG